MKHLDFPLDELFEVERTIARRADEISHERGFDPVHALDNWRQAEREFWEHAAPRGELTALGGER